MRPTPDIETPSKQTNLRLSITVVVEKDEGGYYAHVPAFKGLHVDGRTESEAMENAKEAIKVYMRSLATHNDPIPIGPDCTVLREEKFPPIPAGAMLHHLELQWPSLRMSGIS
ncbi:MAG TPA: type II toxin-antitoxin system HicB family antitoxin [Terriglobales bacterium]|nr:type II toxin-antitoxin system HicB family antitoxin [Terriglobales bacterium]